MQVVQEEVSSPCNKDIFYSENDHKAPHTETCDDHKSLLLSQWALWEDRRIDNSTIKMYYLFKTG